MCACVALAEIINYNLEGRLTLYNSRCRHSLQSPRFNRSRGLITAVAACDSWDVLRVAPPCWVLHADMSLQNVDVVLCDPGCPSAAGRLIIVIHESVQWAKSSSQTIMNTKGSNANLRHKTTEVELCWFVNLLICWQFPPGLDVVVINHAWALECNN